MYSVYRRLNGRYDRVATFKTLGEASDRVDALRRRPSVDSQCLYYVTGPGLPTPDGLVVSHERSVARAPYVHPTPRRGFFAWLAQLFQRPASTAAPSAQPHAAVAKPVPPPTARQPLASRPTATSTPRRDRSLGPRTFGRSADDRREWGDDERWDDIALAHRTEEELGLGIPAQTDRGRRNRKGWYIP